MSLLSIQRKTNQIELFCELQVILMGYQPDIKYILIGVTLVIILYLSVRDKLNLHNKEAHVIKRDINLELLAVTILSVVLLVFLSVYFASEFKTILMQYNNTITQKTNISEQLSIYKQELNETSILKDRIEEDKKNLENKYFAIRADWDNLHIKPTCNN